ncbi:PopZ family protein [Stappia sp.]|uniref:PopZ family protein n=1 Tax=Stappia sp. TaxID=1870903 RepID=UPI003C7BC4A0
MEEILASIRRIISDEETPAAEAEDSAAGPEAVVEDDDSAEMSQDDLDKLFDSAGDDEIEFQEPEAKGEPEPEVEAEPDAEADDVLELTEDLAVADADDAFEMVEGLASAEEEVGDIAFVEEEPAPAAASQTTSERFTEELLSPTANQAVHSAFNNLAGTILSNNARTLEDLVKEMLRPMLKSWLDENLPPMVERLVRQEIERVSRGR